MGLWVYLSLGTSLKHLPGIGYFTCPHQGWAFIQSELVLLLPTSAEFLWPEDKWVVPSSAPVSSPHFSGTEVSHQHLCKEALGQLQEWMKSKEGAQSLLGTSAPC